MATKKQPVKKAKKTMAVKKPVTTKKSTIKKQSKKNQSFLSKLHFRQIAIVLAVVVFASIGAYLLFSSKAAAPTLTWAPPTGYQNYPVKNVSVSSSVQTISGGGADMLVKLPNSPTGPITLTDCRNVVIIGGQINLPKNSGPGEDIKAIYVKGCTGTVHIEGVYINGDIATAEGDGVAINAPNAIVQLQNMRIYKLYGGYETAYHNHSDIVQPWGGVKELRIDYMTGSSNYQGYQINDDINHIGKVIIKNANIGDSGVPPVDSKGGYYAWLKCGTGTTYSFSNFYVQPRSGKTLSNSLYDSNQGACGMNVNSTSATFSNSAVTGTIQAGKPTSGDFVPAGVAGIGYSSPGYGGTASTTDTTGGTTSGGTTTTPPPPTDSGSTTTTPPAPKEVINFKFDNPTTSMQSVLSSWGVSSGRYVNTSTKSNLTTNSNLGVNPTVVSGDFTLTTLAQVKGTSSAWDDYSVVFGYKDVKNYYYASFNESNDGGTSGIFKMANGKSTQLKDISTLIKSDTDYKVTIVRSGTNIKISLNDSEVASVADGTFTSGKVGYGSRNNAVSFDNLLVTQ